MRVKVFIVFTIFIWVMILLRLFSVQIVKGESYSETAKRQHKKGAYINTDRGCIYDRNGRLLAFSVPAKSCFALPHKISNPPRTANILSAIGLKEKEKILSLLTSKGKFVWIERYIEDSMVDRLNQYRLSGIFIAEDKRRYYPVAGAGNLIGFCGEDSKGLEGIEYEFDSILNGKAGFAIFNLDANGHTLLEYFEKNPEKGCDLILTIDSDIQRIVTEELEIGMKRYNASAGNCIVLDPKTGEILAIANFPYHNPNHKGNGHAAKWRNRAVADIFEPGSTFKIVTAAAAIQENIIHPDDSVDVENGSLIICGHEIKDVKEYKKLTFSEIIEKSSNIGVVKIAKRVGKEKLYLYARSFGFGCELGIDLPGEREGIITTPEKWSEIHFANIALGQGVAVTGLQLAFAYQAIANDGVLTRPLIVRKIVGKNGKIKKEFFPQTIRRVVSSKTAEILRGILHQVLESGTGRRARLSIPVSGKTGTAQKSTEKGYSKDKFFASFVGFFPTDDPKFLISIVVDEPKGKYQGGEVAAPIFRNIGERLLNLSDYWYLNICQK